MIYFLICLPDGKRVQATPSRPAGVTIDYEKKTWSPRHAWSHESGKPYPIGTARSLMKGQVISNELIGVFEIDDNDPEQLNLMVGVAQEIATLNI